MRTVVGLDTSLTGTGVAVVAGSVIQTQTLRSKGARGDSLAARVARLRALREEILGWVPEGALVALEGPAISKNTGSLWDRAGLWWTVVDHISRRDFPNPIVLVPPSSRAKYGTGRGNSSKMDVMAATIKRFPQLEIRNDNEADALLLAAMGARLLGDPIDNPPLTHIKAMDGLELPDWMAAV